MSRLPGWVAKVSQELTAGLERSPIGAYLTDDIEVYTVGKACCFNLWPFIKDLPENISFVKDKLSDDMESAKKLLGKLADEERYYQKLFIDQCYLAGFTDADLQAARPSGAAIDLCNAMRAYCREHTYVEGIQIIVAAELAATVYARYCLPSYENYFARNKDRFAEKAVEEGLAWLKLHAKTQMRQAILLKKMLDEIGESKENESLPEPVEVLLRAMLKLWQQLPAGTRSPS